MPNHQHFILAVSALACLSVCTGCFVARDKAGDSYEPTYPKINLVAGYQVDPTWPRRPAECDWGAVPGIAVDAEDRIWVITRGSMPVQIYRPDGTFLGGWGQGHFRAIHQIRFDTHGQVWIADAQRHTVEQFTPDGQLLLTIGTPDEAGDDENHLNLPTDMVISSTGDVFISDGYGNNRVVHFDRKGQFIKSWGRKGTGPGEFSLPHSIAMDSSGQLYVAERNNARIQVFDQEGHLLRQFPQVLVPWTILITPEDDVLVCGSSPMRWGSERLLGLPPKDQIIIRFDRSGCARELWTFPLGSEGKEKPGELNWLHGIALDSMGNLYLGDIKGQRAQKFNLLPVEKKK